MELEERTAIALKDATHEKIPEFPKTQSHVHSQLLRTSITSHMWQAKSPMTFCT